MYPKQGFRVWLTKLERWGPALLWMFVIYKASADSQSVRHSSRIIEPFFRWLMPHITYAQLETVHLAARKGAHMTEYAFLSILLLRALCERREELRKWAVTAWFLATAFAATDEFHQLWIPGRDGNPRDVLIDSTGAALALFAWVKISRALGSKPAASPSPAGAPQQVAAPSRLPLPEPPLCILEGENPENQTQVRLVVDDRLLRENRGSLILGRKRASVQLCIKNTSISNQHLSLIFRDGQFEIEDRNSSNGTLVNGRQLAPFQPERLANGDQIEVGEVVLHFRALT